MPRRSIHAAVSPPRTTHAVLCSRTARIVAHVYLLNPYSIMSCVGMTTTPLTNLLVALALLNAAKARAR